MKTEAPPPPYVAPAHRAVEVTDMLAYKPFWVGEARFTEALAAWHRERMAERRQTLFALLCRKAYRSFVETYADRLQTCLFAFRMIEKQALPRDPRPIAGTADGVLWETVEPPLPAVNIDLSPIETRLAEDLLVAACTSGGRQAVEMAVETARRAIEEALAAMPALGGNLFEALCACCDADAPEGESEAERDARRAAYVRARLQALIDRAVPTVAVTKTDGAVPPEAVIFRLPHAAAAYRTPLALDAVIGPLFPGYLDAACPAEEVLCFRLTVAAAPGYRQIPVMARSADALPYRCYRYGREDRSPAHLTPHLDPRWEEPLRRLCLGESDGV